MFCCNRLNEKSNRSGLGSGQGQIPGRGPRGAKLTDRKGILTDIVILVSYNYIQNNFSKYKEVRPKLKLRLFAFLNLGSVKGKQTIF